MKPLRSILLFSFAVAVVGVFQAPAGAVPLAYWSLNDSPVTNGATCHDTYNNYNMTYGIASGSCYATTGVWGVPHTAVHFGGSDFAYWTGSAVPLYYQSNYTIEAFFKLDGSSDDERTIYSENTWCGEEMSLEVRYGNNLYFQVKDQDNDWQSLQMDSVSLVPGRWYYAAAVMTNDTPTTYLYDESTGAKTTLAADWSVGSDRDTDLIHACVGGGYDNGSAAAPFVGVLDNVAIYGTSLSDSTVWAHATANTDIPEPTTAMLLAVGLAAGSACAWRKRR